MKLATRRNKTRDGQLLVVARDLRRCSVAPIRTLQLALDNWADNAPVLEECYKALNCGDVQGESFGDEVLESPLPRAYAWMDGSAYVNHVELVRKARGAEMPEDFWTNPLMYQGGSDAFLGPCDDIAMASTEWGIDFEAEVAVITDDVPMGVSEASAGSHIKLLMIVNDVSLRNLIPGELGKGFGFFQSKPSTAFSPVAVTPDELGEHWKENVVQRPLTTYLNEKIFGEPLCHHDMTFNFSRLITHAAMTRPLTAGSILGSGTISNLDRSKGSSCLAERRMLEKINDGKVTTPFMQYGDCVRIEMFDVQQQSIFGAINQKVVTYTPPN